MRAARQKIILVAGITLVGLIVGFLVARHPGQTRTYDCPFSDVESFLSSTLQQDLRGAGFKGFSGPTNLLADGIVYALEVYEYVPGRRLVFEARMGQIGSETFTFAVESVGVGQTAVSVGHSARMFLFPSSSSDRENELLNMIGVGVQAKAMTGK